MRLAAVTYLALLEALNPGHAGSVQQARPTLILRDSLGAEHRLAILTERGFAAVEFERLSALGWSHRREGDDWVVDVGRGPTLRLRPGTPLVRWGPDGAQLVDAPYEEDGALRIPVQVLSDMVPRRLAGAYSFESARTMLTQAAAGVRPTEPEGPAAPIDTAAAAPIDTAAAPEEDAGGADRSPPESTARVVIIDAGHGGSDPGALGRGGVREKDVALGVSLALRNALEGLADPGIEVHMIRESDTFVPLWSRGETATDVKGPHPGVFVSVHANSHPVDRTARGFETYFLSEARTEHERRVAAIENAPLRLENLGPDLGPDPDLGFILRELRTLDHQHWSALLAELVQEEMSGFHPGPNRGVKQGVLAVLTNALMPAVLVEVGYVSSPDEAPLLSDPEFQAAAAGAIAKAVLRFFERYPPGTGARREEGRP